MVSLMQYQVIELPVNMGQSPPPEDVLIIEKVLRHLIVTVDGQFWVQDETLYSRYTKAVDSHRTPWEKLASPPIEHTFVGMAEWQGVPFAFRSDGRAFAWGFGPEGPEGEQDALPHWHPVHEPAPRT